MNRRGLLLVAGMLTAFTATAQVQDTPVDYSKYPDYSTFFNPDKSFYTYGEGPQVNIHQKSKVKKADDYLPSHVDNSQKIFFPPVFNQSGGSCGSASRICYMFTYELNAYRNLNGKDPSNYYPSHFVWLLTNGNSGKDAFVQYVGVPSAAIYGGQTYSSQFGYQVETDNNFGWMNGYDKWYAAMHNRMWAPSHIPVNVGTEEGRTYMKRWIYNHNGDNDFHAGGIAGIGVASGGDWQKIGSTTVNKELGVNGKYYVKKWGTSVDHALTIVGYDDRIEFDLDGNGVYGEKSKDEVGAWIIVNSWGAGWCNNGFVYCPYKHAVTAFTSAGQPNGSYYAPEIYRVRKDYRPLRTIKLKMDYNRRSEIAISAGISTDVNATEPEQTIPFHHFRYAGDGANGNTNPAPEIPMLGKWADGKLHTEPMEFGYDLTDLTAGADRNKPIKYFFIIETKSWAKGSGNIYQASIMDYKLDTDGIETPFDCSDESPIEIKSAGKKTIISVIVYGDGYTEPRNLRLDEATMKWDSPTPSGHTVSHYNIYVDGIKVAETKDCKYTFDAITGSAYSVTALYSDGNETKKVTINAPIQKSEQITVYEFSRSGFSIPDIFDSRYSECTIEFYIRPTSLVNYNQSAGPGWGSFMMHANSDGSYTFGWDTSNRTSTGAGSLQTSMWKHVAIVVNKNKMTCYMNGAQVGAFTSSSYSGIGGFGDFQFTASNSNNNYLDARMDEIRIWNYARTKTEISKNYKCEFTGKMMPKGLLAYYKGDVITRDGKTYLKDEVGGHHAEVLTDGFKSITTNTPKLTDPTETASVSINDITGTITPGMPVTLSAQASTSICRLVWTCPQAKIDSIAVTSPTVSFPAAGEYTVTATAFTYAGEKLEAEKTFTVEATPEIDASFECPKSVVAAGEHITLMAKTPVSGYIYTWSLPGARKEVVNTMCAGVTYDNQGTYDVTLTVSAPDGKSASTTQHIEVSMAAPVSDFRVTPSVILKGDTTYLVDESKLGPTQWTWTLESNSQDYIVKGQNSSFVPAKGGVYDVTLSTSNEMGQSTTKRERVLYVCNADSKNGLSLIGYPNARVTTQSLPLDNNSKEFTIDFWLEQSTLSDFCNGIGDAANTMMLQATERGILALYVDGKSVYSPADFVQTDGWHHYAVVFNGNNLGKTSFYRDGDELSSTYMNKTSVPTMKKFCIGANDAPFTGRLDEFRVWNTALTKAKIREYCVEPIADIATAQQEDQLKLYYDFNQSGGDVEDRTSNNNLGMRTGFGPDGDAWGLSTGVFAICCESKSVKTVTADYFSNYEKPFQRTTTTVNNSTANRFYGIKSWTLENQVKAGGVTTGVHVDTQKSNCFTCTAEWDGFADLNDHKAFQTFTLPAGVYTFTAEYDDTYEGQCGDSYLVVSEGKSLPNTDELGSAIASMKMEAKSGTCTKNTLTFSLETETEVSMGMLINQNGKICMTIQKFSLTAGGAIVIEADGKKPVDAVEAPTSGSITRPTASYDLQGRRIAGTPTRPGLYIINGRKMVIK